MGGVAIVVHAAAEEVQWNASDRPIVFVLSGDREVARESHMIEAMVRGAICVEAQQQ